MTEVKRDKSRLERFLDGALGDGGSEPEWEPVPQRRAHSGDFLLALAPGIPALIVDLFWGSWRGRRRS